MQRFKLGAKKSIVIAGPCSAESREQTLDTAIQLHKTGVVDAYRAGIWKPRTTPGSFEGVGERGLEWMVEARKATGLPIAVEVASAKHVESALEHGVDILWIGARTTVSPFAVQDIADALRGSKDVVVLIKNPVNPDLDLWSGAVQRFENEGVSPDNIGLIHRGFSYFGHSQYRNAPMWHLALEMRERHPNMTMLCDPSHICGNRTHLQQVSQTAADMMFDGLIIESHISPDNAMSDAAQQITPKALGELVHNIRWRKGTTDNIAYREALEQFRGQIDQIDSEIYELLSRRMRVAEKIGEVKHRNNVAILQQRRWGEIVNRMVSQAERLDLSEEFIRAILNAIHTESMSRQNRIMNREQGDE